MSLRLVSPAPPAPEHVALVAYGPSMHQYVELAKALGGRRRFADEVWGVNAVGEVLACDRVFHMDDVAIQEIRAAAEPESNIATMLGWLATHPGPIYTSRAYPRYPGLVEYPLEAVLRSQGGMPYFNSTPAYAIALALHLGVRTLSLFGLDYTYPDAHHAEKGRGCVEFWLGRAHAAGVDIRVSSRSTLLDSCEGAPPLYGYGRFGTRDVALEYDEAGLPRVVFTGRASLPTAAEIEAAYDHARHPSPLVSGLAA